MAHELPQCPNYLQGRCRRSDVKLMAEHGTTQVTWYTTFFCRTCRYLFVGHWNQGVVAAAKRKELDREIGSLMSPRFRGLA